MEFFVLSLLLLSGGIVFNCVITIYRERKDFDNKMVLLEEQFEQQKQKNILNEIQIEQSRILMEKIKKSNAHLNETILDLNANLFAELFLKKDYQ